MDNQIKMKRRLWVLTVFLFATVNGFAQAGSITDVKPVFDKLKAIKSYSYEFQTTAIFPNGQKDQQHTRIYLDRLNRKLSYRSEQEVVMLNQHWLFKADHENKTASVFDVVKYDKKNKDILPQIEAVFRYDMASMFMDSVLFRYGKLLATTKKKDLIIYKIGFKDEGAALKEMTIEFNTVTQLPERIYFRMENSIQNGKKVKMDILCHNYTTVVPQSVFDEKQYFNIVKGKPVLVQFKNYKLYSVL